MLNNVIMAKKLVLLDELCLSRKIGVEYNKKLCVICQKNQEIAAITGEKGRDRIRWASQIRKDDVYQRLLTLQDNDEFVYHMRNECYKNYTHKIKVERASKAVNNIDFDENGNNSAERTESSSFRRSIRIVPEQSKNIEIDSAKRPCLICGKVKSGNERKKYRISEADRAEKLLTAAKHFQDSVFTKIAHLQTVDDVFAADLYSHSKCLRSYEKAFERNSKATCSNGTVNDIADIENGNAEFTLPKTSIIVAIIKNLKPRLEVGEAFSLSEITNEISAQYGPDVGIQNRDVKDVLIKEFGEDLSFSYSSDANKPILFYSSRISDHEVIKTLRADNSIERCAKMLKQSLENHDFGVEDKFCDEHDLRLAWESIELPQPLQTFFSILFDVKKNDLNDKNGSAENDGNDKSQKTLTKVLRVKALFQMMYFVLKDGKKRTPFHVITGLSVHSASKSKALVTSLNRTGVSISYDEVQRYRSNLAAFTVQSCRSFVPIPTHFDPKNFTTAAFDNFDHEEATLSGLDGTHDTVSVLFQDDTSSLRGKPTVSEAGLDHRNRGFTDQLECQELKPFTKPPNVVSLPTHYVVVEDHGTFDGKSFKMRADDMAWFLSRMGIRKFNQPADSQSPQQIPSWTAFNSVLGVDDRPTHKVGFLPILPHPVTEYATVYTALCNFKDVLRQLDQKYLPVACDEGVYRIARHIQLLREQEFDSIILFLGSFHTVKVLFASIGKYLRGSGAENIFIETGLFGIGVTEQVLSGTNYARSLNGLFVLAEALTRLQLHEFLTEERLIQYNQQAVSLEILEDTISEQNFEEARQILKEFELSSEELLNDFQDFVTSRNQDSPLFRYWSNVLYLVSLARDFIRADREGNWQLHKSTLKKAQPVFHVMDRSNYARWSSLYLEDMMKLEHTAPEVHAEFQNGRFTVKRTHVPFTAVGTDQALEQTINRAQKSVSGIIGATQQKQYVAAWNMIYHEILSIHNYYREITFLTNDNNELQIHHQYSTSYTDQSESAVTKILTFLSNHVNPFMQGSQPLRNIVTEEVVDPKNAEKLLNCLTKGDELYQAFRKERFVDKIKPLSATIHRANLPSFMTANKGDSVTAKKKKKNIKLASHRIVELAKERNYCLRDLFSYELTSENPLFDKDGLLKKESNKSSLMSELEKVISKEENLENVTRTEEICLVVDVMMICRRIKWKELVTFNDFGSAFCNYVQKIASQQLTTRIDFVFDAYFEKSPKAVERFRRSPGESITIHNIHEGIKLPVQESKFWASSENKILLQKFIRAYIFKYCSKFSPVVELICSSTDRDECISNNPNRPLATLETLQRSDIEEADVRLMLHISHAACEGSRNMFVLSADTDVFVLALSYWGHFKAHGLQTLWMRVGVAASTRTLPLHVIAERHGENVCAVLPALHHLTGADYTSKVGTKNKALRADPEILLHDFARNSSEASVNRSVEAAEEYLVRVLKKGSPCKTFDGLRFWLYHNSKSIDINDLPPTSASIRLHILRAFYVTYIQINCLNAHAEKLDAPSFGYVEDDDMLVPRQVLSYFPPATDLLPSCSCKVCARKSCGCVAAEMPCCAFCSCQSTNTCKNVHTNKVDD